VKRIDLPNQLSHSERISLKYKETQKLASFARTASKLFDSKANWSTMIKPDNNDVRNDVMRRISVTKSKRREMHEF
jgi:hypothetical protein